MGTCTAAWNQKAYRGRNDNGNETTATWKANQNTTWTQPVDTNFRVRFEIQETAGCAGNNMVWRLQYKLNSGSWTDVSAASSVVRASASPNLADAANLTDQLTVGTGTFVGATGFDEVDGNAGGSSMDVAAGGHAECEFCVQIRSADVTTTDTVYLRATAAGTAFAAYDANCSIDVYEVTVKNFADTLALTSLTSTPKLSKTTTFADTLALSSLTGSAKLTKVTTFSDTLALTSLTSNAALTLGTVYDFSDTLALTSLTSTPKITRQFAFSDTLALSTLTSTPDLFKLVDFRTEKLVDAITVNVGTLTSGDKTNTYTANDSRLVITEGTGLDNAYDVEFVFKGITDIPYGVFIEGYYQGNPAHNVKLKIKNNSDDWIDVTANTRDLPSNSSDQNYFFNLPELTNYISGGQIILKIEHTSPGTPGHTLNIDKIIVMPIVTSLTSSPKITLQTAFSDTLALTSLTSTPVLTVVSLINFSDSLGLTSLTSTPVLSVMTVKNFSDVLALSSLTSDAKLFRDVTFSDTLALSSLTSTADLFRSVDFSDALALTSLTSDATLSLGAIYNFSDTLALTSLTSTPKLFRLVEFGDTLVLTSLTSDPELKIGGINNFSDTLSLTSLTSSPSLRILVEKKTVTVLYDGSIVINNLIRI